MRNAFKKEVRRRTGRTERVLPAAQQSAFRFVGTGTHASPSRSETSFAITSSTSATDMRAILDRSIRVSSPYIPVADAAPHNHWHMVATQNIDREISGLGPATPVLKRQ